MGTSLPCRNEDSGRAATIKESHKERNETQNISKLELFELPLDFSRGLSFMPGKAQAPGALLPEGF